MAKKTVAQRIRLMSDEDLVRNLAVDKELARTATNFMVKRCAQARVDKMEDELARRDVQRDSAPRGPQRKRLNTKPYGNKWAGAIITAMQAPPKPTGFAAIARNAALIRGCKISGGAYVAMQKLIKDGVVAKDGKDYSLVK